MTRTIHIWPLLLVGTFQNFPQNINGCVWLDGNTRQNPLLMDIPDQRLGVCLLVGFLLRALGRAGKGSFIVEAIKIGARVLEFLDPFLGLGDHHVAVEGSASVVRGGLVDVFPYLGDNWGAECDIGNEMAIHDINVQPVRALIHGLGTLGAELGEVCRQYGWCNYRFGSHGEIVQRVETM